MEKKKKTQEAEKTQTDYVCPSIVICSIETA